jgi:hypothetical protein
MTMKTLVDDNRLKVLKQGDAVETTDKERARIAAINYGTEEIRLVFDRRRFQTVNADFINASFREVNPISTQIENETREGVFVPPLEQEEAAND